MLLDGDIRRGTDIFKALALALSARAVLVARPFIHAATAGAAGVAMRCIFFTH